MNYLDEIMPIVAKLTERYTAGDSTSVTYEKAEQLMGAVLYCIREAEYAEENRRESEIACLQGMSAQRAYETGLACVEKKVKAALALYNDMQTQFDSYGNRCLYDTFVKGIPEFFKWYDMRFAPQDTILTLDYPVLKDLSAYTGIDRIYEYLLCIQKEQEFLRTFPRNDVIDALARYNPVYEDMIDNVCGAVGEVMGGKEMV